MTNRARVRERKRKMNIRRRVVGFQSGLPKAAIDTPWGWTTEAQNEVLGSTENPDWERYKKAHLYYDPEEADTKAGYKLPIAKMVGGRLSVVFRGVSAAMAAINGARGGVDLPEAVQDEIYKVLVKYYNAFDKEAPERRSVEVEEEKSVNKKEELASLSRVVSVEKVGDETHYVLQSRQSSFLPVELTELGGGYKKEEEEKYYNVRGVASSTSIDHYGTEMSYDALMDMAQQMRAGIPILPAHNSFSEGGFAEWDDVIGRTYEAEVKRADVIEAADPMERQFVLVLHSKLYKEEDKALQLARRLERGEPIGQSIGGWFDSVRAIENKSGEIERVIVDRVVLDHVAITRAPANPDSRGLAQMSIRSCIDTFKREKLMEEKQEELETVDVVTEEAVDAPEVELSEATIDVVSAMPDIDVVTNTNKVEDTVAAVTETETELSGTDEDAVDVEETVNDETAATEPVEVDELRAAEEKFLAAQKEYLRLKEASQPEEVAASSLNTQNVEIDNKIVDNLINSNQVEVRSAINSTSQEIDMTKEELQLLVAETVSRALEANNHKPEIKEVEVQNDTSELEERVRKQELLINKLLEEPVRQGRSTSTHQYMRKHLNFNDGITELCAFARTRGDEALPTFVEGNIETISSETIGSLSRHELTDLLATGLRAAEADGYFK